MMATIGGNTDGMKRPVDLRVDQSSTPADRLPRDQRAPARVPLRPEVLAFVGEALAVRVHDDPERDAVEPRDDAAVEARRPGIDGDGVASARIADRLARRHRASA